MQAAAARSSTRFLKNLASAHRSTTITSPSFGRVIPANFSTAAETKTVNLKNRPLSPFLSQKRPEKSSTLSIGERMVLITLGFVVLPAPEIAKLSLFIY